MKKVALAEIVAELENGSRPEGGVNEKGDIFSIGGEHLNDFGGFDFSSVKLVSHDFFNQMKRGKVKPNDIIIVKDGATTGKTSFVNERFPYFPCAINEHVFRLAVKQEVADSRYVFYYLYSPTGNKEILDDFRGATVGGISQDFVNKVFIPLPPLTEQKRIASLLARADRLRGLRRHAKRLADSLLQSVFLEMFGEPRTNPKKFDLVELGEIVEINPSGRPKANPEQPTSFLPMNLVDPSHMYTDELDIKKFQEVSTGYTYFQENDVLFAKITPCMENGNIAIARNLINGFGFGSTEFHVIRPNEKINAAWIYGVVKRLEFRTEATRWFRGTAGQQRVPSDFLESYRVPLPPLPLQEEFARAAARVESLRRRMAESERQAEELFQALLALSFTEGLAESFGQ